MSRAKEVWGGDVELLKLTADLESGSREIVLLAYRRQIRYPFIAELFFCFHYYWMR